MMNSVVVKVICILIRVFSYICILISSFVYLIRGWGGGVIVLNPLGTSLTGTLTTLAGDCRVIHACME